MLVEKFNRQDRGLGKVITRERSYLARISSRTQTFYLQITNVESYVRYGIDLELCL